MWVGHSARSSKGPSHHTVCDWCTSSSPSSLYSRGREEEACRPTRTSANHWNPEQRPGPGGLTRIRCCLFREDHLHLNMGTTPRRSCACSYSSRASGGRATALGNDPGVLSAARPYSLKPLGLLNKPTHLPVLRPSYVFQRDYQGRMGPFDDAL